MKIGFILSVIVALLINTAEAQVRSYVTTGTEIIFSFANIDNDDIAPNNIIRFSPVFNLQVYGNLDFNKHIGLLYGGAIRNVGFIDGNTDPDNSNIKKKYRNYNLGLPIGIKFGNLSKLFFFGGYEIEFPFHYKEKTFVNGVKQDNKISTWFTKRVPTVYNSVFAGIQFPYGLNLKFKYYFTNFHNEDFTETVNGEVLMPYKGYKSNVFYFSLSFALFQDTHVYYNENNKPKQTY